MSGRRLCDVDLPREVLGSYQCRIDLLCVREAAPRPSRLPNNPPNACYDIGGAAQSPSQVTVVFFIHAVGIPANAATTVDFVTPWNTLHFPSATDSSDQFSKIWFRNKGHGVAAIFGGSDAPDNFFKYDDEGTGGNIFNGAYSVTTTVRVHGVLLHAHGTLKIDC
jgi:hypothetical protein